MKPINYSGIKESAHWSPQEIKILLEEYSKFQDRHVVWNQILAKLPQKTRQQCVSYINNHRKQLLNKQTDNYVAELINVVSSPSFQSDGQTVLLFEFDQQMKQLLNNQMNINKHGWQNQSVYYQEIMLQSFYPSRLYNTIHFINSLSQNDTLMMNLTDQQFILDVLYMTEFIIVNYMLGDHIMEFKQHIFQNIPDSQVQAIIMFAQIQMSYLSLSLKGAIFSHSHKSMQRGALVSIFVFQFLLQISFRIQQLIYQPSSRVQIQVEKVLDQFFVHRSWWKVVYENFRINEILQISIQSYIQRFGVVDELLDIVVI